MYIYIPVCVFGFRRFDCSYRMQGFIIYVSVIHDITIMIYYYTMVNVKCQHFKCQMLDA